MARFFTLLVAAAGLLVQTTSALPAPMVPYPYPNGTVPYPTPLPTGTGAPVPFPTAGYFPVAPSSDQPKERALRNPRLNFPKPY